MTYGTPSPAMIFIVGRPTVAPRIVIMGKRQRIIVKRCVLTGVGEVPVGDFAC
jgi:hypothetical protein